VVVLVGLAGLVSLSGCAPPPPRPAAPPPRPAEPEAAAPAVESEPEPPPAPALPFRMPCADDDLVGCTNGCDDKITEDCVTLGAMYLGGAVVTVDRERAVGLFRAACGADSARACLKLGDAFHAGLVPPEPGKSRDPHAEEVIFYRRACDDGANLGCVAAGRDLVSGHGVGKDAAAAAPLFDKVCSRGNAAACLELGRLYQRGEGVAKRPERAVEMFQKACKLGLDEGCLRADRTGEERSPRE
jgi:hypothetical protein